MEAISLNKYISFLRRFGYLHEAAGYHILPAPPGWLPRHPQLLHSGSLSDRIAIS